MAETKQRGGFSGGEWVAERHALMGQLPMSKREDWFSSFSVIAVSKRFKDQVLMLEVPMRGVAPLLEVVKRLRSSSEHLTTLRPDFLQLCLLAKCYKTGLSILEDDIFEVKETLLVAREGRVWCLEDRLVLGGFDWDPTLQEKACWSRRPFDRVCMPLDKWRGKEELFKAADKNGDDAVSMDELAELLAFQQENEPLINCCPVCGEILEVSDKLNTLVHLSLCFDEGTGNQVMTGGFLTDKQASYGCELPQCQLYELSSSVVSPILMVALLYVSVEMGD
ncbi:hypothetical protein D5086_030477 [Populus alba]|uniref:Uncharacterized protein n=1 Tax=Populus alba TaxID=43335 RepID=A0ACC4AP81_POPAL